jgi:uncharacterized protein (TIGR02996 family)
MSDEEGFLRTIIDNPDDDAPRLIFADWLEERGDLRGEFIRIQCALTRLAIGDERRPDLIRREQALQVEHGETWLGPLKLLVKGWQFRRGFVESATLPGRQFLIRATEIFNLAPIRELRLTNLGMGNFPADDLAAIEQLTRVDALELAGAAGDERISAILRSKRLKQITRLQLDEVRCGEQTLRLISRANFPRLAALELIDNDLSHFANLICRMKVPLQEYSIKSESGALKRDNVIELARAKNLAGLTLLDLRNSSVQVPGAVALAKSKVLTKLRALGLKGCAIGVTGMQALADSASLAGLTAFNVEGNHIGIKGLRSLSASRWDNLISLNLARNDLDGRCVSLLREWPGLGRLRYLSLGSNEIDDAAMTEFLSAPELAHIWHLDLRGIVLGPMATEALNNAPHLDIVRRQKGYYSGFSRYDQPAGAHAGARINIQ